MKKYLKIFLAASALFAFFTDKGNGQTDNELPVAPELNLVTVNHLTEAVEISWTPSPSPDLLGYVVYLFNNNEGYALDTIFDPSAVNFIRTGSGSSYFSESFVVAALDSAGNISPLSNELKTIWLQASLDTCNMKLEISWNKYISSPLQVLNYSIMMSADGGNFNEVAVASQEKTSFVLNDFNSDTQYCFIVRANLAGGAVSGSNKTCVFSVMQRPPQWINADYVTTLINDDLLLSFTVDPLSEINTFDLERRTGRSGTFQQIKRFTEESGTISFTDKDTEKGNVYFYRLSAVNNCETKTTISNIASNVVLTAENNNNSLILKWNPYREWMGTTELYKLYINTKDSFEEIKNIPPSDTSFSISYSDFMYEVSGNEVCFRVKAIESHNPHGIAGESNSSTVCIPVIENITVPNIFTPDNNLINDHFRPVLSFTPVEYQILITDMKRKIIFSSRDFTEEWDGTMNGNPLPEGVYLWMLTVKTPSGKNISRSGTVTIKFNL